MPDTRRKHQRHPQTPAGFLGCPQCAPIFMRAVERAMDRIPCRPNAPITGRAFDRTKFEILKRDPHA